jgi:hypothetical protein
VTAATGGHASPLAAKGGNRNAVLVNPSDATATEATEATEATLRDVEALPANSGS